MFRLVQEVMYPGCQRLFMRGFRFRVFKVTRAKSPCFSHGFTARRPKTTKLLVAVFSPPRSSAKQREKKPLVPRVVVMGIS